MKLKSGCRLVQAGPGPGAGDSCAKPMLRSKVDQPDLGVERVRVFPNGGYFRTLLIYFIPLLARHE